jgi:hypothetical protein
MVENVQWTRLRKRVGHAEVEHAKEWLLGVATLAAGVAASALIAYAVLPSATTSPVKGADVVASGTRPTLLATSVASAVLAVVFTLLYWQERKKLSNDRSDIQDEMDTIKAAWEASAGGVPRKELASPEA